MNPSLHVLVSQSLLLHLGKAFLFITSEASFPPSLLSDFISSHSLSSFCPSKHRDPVSSEEEASLIGIHSLLCKCALPPFLSWLSSGFQASRRSPPHFLSYSHSSFRKQLSALTDSTASSPKHGSVYPNLAFPQQATETALSRARRIRFCQVQ